MTSSRGAAATPGFGLGPWRRGEVDGFEPFPDDALAGSVTRRFFEVAARHPERRALSSPAGSWSYAELATEVRRRAGDLAARRPAGAPVALVMAHDGPLVVAILTVLASGSVLVLVDPAAPPDQQRHVLVESGAALVVHDDANRARADELCAQPAVRARATCVAWDQITGDDAVAPPADAASAQTPALLAFTSGTSGEPKAAVITHGVLLNVVRGATNALGIGPDDRMPMLFPTSLAVAAYPLFLPLLNGGTLATLDVRSVGLEPVGEFLARERVTVAYLAPTVVRFLVDALAGREFPDLRLVALGGELVDAAVLRLTAEMFDPQMIAVGYGTTESGVVSLHVQAPGDPTPDQVPCGHPVADVDIVVLDEVGTRLAPGSSGEIAIASPYLFGGYRGHPELNRQVLADDPAARPGWRLYRTGDYGCVDAGGELVVVGRIDTKVKVRGRMVVLGDVESDLQALDGVADAAVVAVSRGSVNELVAYVAPALGATLDARAMRAELLTTRESFRVPSRFEVLDELPRLPNGKVDRRALPDVDAVEGLPSAARDDAPSRTTLADADRVRRQIRDLWEELLPIGVVGLDEDFAELGGDSLLAAQMLVLLEQRTGVTVPMGRLVHARTVRELAGVVVRLRAQGDDRPSTVAMVQAGDVARPPLWFVHDLQGSAYRIRHLARFLGADEPVWSFESPLLTGIANPFASLEEMARRYVDDLLVAQPDGPYRVAGYSFGGICAYEMARQLVAGGRDVSFLGIVDVGPGYRGPGWHSRRSPFRPWFGVAKPPPQGAGMAEVVRHYREMAAASPLGALRHLMVRSGLARLVDPIRFELELRRRGRIRAEWRLWYAWEQHWRLAAKAWSRSSTYPGRVELFWAEDTPGSDATMGWGPLVGSVGIHRFVGDHEGILEPRGAPALASALREALDA